jgi:hypothetical protein
MAPLPQLLTVTVTSNTQELQAGLRFAGEHYLFLGGHYMSLSKILLILALICFILDALAGRMKFRAPFGLLPGGLALWVASILF